jgi:hypothetical protein
VAVASYPVINGWEANLSSNPNANGSKIHLRILIILVLVHVLLAITCLEKSAVRVAHVGINRLRVKLSFTGKTPVRFAAWDRAVNMVTTTSLLSEGPAARAFFQPPHPFICLLLAMIADPMPPRRWRPYSTYTCHVPLRLSTVLAPGVDPRALFFHGHLEVSNRMDAHSILSQRLRCRGPATERTRQRSCVDGSSRCVQAVPRS